MAARRTSGVTLADLIDDAFCQYGSARALLTPSGWITFSQLENLTVRAVGLLAECGMDIGDRALLYIPNSAAFRIFELAILRAGFVRVAVSSRLHVNEVAAIVVDSGARVVVCAPESANDLRAALAWLGADATVLATADEAPTGDVVTLETIGRGPTGPLSPRIADSDTAMLMYSSGTTGAPKAAIVTHRAWASQLRRTAACLPPIGPGDVVLAVAPMSHFGGSIALDAALFGAGTVTMDEFDTSRVCQAIAEHAVTVLPLVPVMLRELVQRMGQAWAGASTLRSVPYGGSPIALPDLIAATAALPGVLVQFYGLAEALAPLACLTSDQHDIAAKLLNGDAPDVERALRILGSAGSWASGIDVDIRAGRLAVRGDVVMPGYWNRPELTHAVLDDKGWFTTGDEITVDKDCLVHISGRSDDVIITGGFNVSPAEVERVIGAIPGVAEVAVVGLPHSRWGQTVTAAVVVDGGYLGDNALNKLDSRIIAECRALLTSFKKPTAIFHILAIPRNNYGKVDRRALVAVLNETPRHVDPEPH